MSLKDQHDPKSKPKRKRSQTPVSTAPSCDQTDLSEGPSGENTNKRVRFERASSPAPSHLSLKSDWSIDLPTNFKSREAFPFDSREKLKRPASPASSYLSLKTDRSMDLPTNFEGRKAFYLDTISGSERPPSPTLSSVSEWTELFIQPTDFKAEATFNLDPRLFTENHLKCPVCKSMLKDPVSILCGHNFCRDCINTFWDSCTEEYVCSVCGRGSRTRPELHTNTALAEVVKNLQQAGFSPALPACSYAGPEDVACDFCTERRLKAVKSCLTCGVLLCETHIRNHYTIPALQKHTLSDVTGAMQKKHVPAGSSSSTTVEKDNHTDKTPNDKKLEQVKSSVVKTKCPKKSQRTSRPKSRVIEDISDVSRLQIMYSTLQQELSGLKKSFSEFSKKEKTKKEKSYDVDKRNYEKKEDDKYSEKSSDASDDDEGEEDDFDEEEEEDGSNSEEEEDDEKDGSDSEEDEDDEKDGSDSEEDEDDEEDGSDSEEYEDDEKDGSDSEDEEDKNYSYDDDDDYNEENNSEDYYKDSEERYDEEDHGDEEERYEGYYEGTSERYKEKDIYEDYYERSSNDEDNYSDYGI